MLDRPAIRRGFWNLILVVDLALLGAAAIDGLRTTHVEPVRAGDVVAGTLVLATLMVLVPHKWIQAHHDLTSTESWHRLGLNAPSAREVGLGAVVGVGLLVVLVGSGILAAAVGRGIPDGAGLRLQGEEWTLLLVFPLLAGLVEEVFFRGFLQRYTGWMGQAVLFALFHAPFPTLLHAAIPLAAGLTLGWLRHTGHSLWTPLVAHAVYDGALLLLSQYRT